MYYVAKTYSYAKPVIVEEFEKSEDAYAYAEIMNRASKGTFIVLKPITE